MTLPLDYDEEQERILAYNWRRMEKRAIQELQGVAMAVIFDGIVTDDEIELLSGWLNRNSQYREKWPISDFWSLLQHILADGVVTEQERLHLFTFLESITNGPRRVDPHSADESASDGLCDNQPLIIFQKKSFLITGKLKFAKRKEAQAQVAAREGICKKSPVKNLDYLIIGDLGSSAWRTSRFGHKIEVVMDRRSKGEGTIIASEADFVRALVCENKT